jgi:phage gp29-like protein
MSGGISKHTGRVLPHWYRPGTPAGVVEVLGRGPSGLAPTSVAQRQPPALPVIIQPDARDRWMAAQVSMYTPERIEATIRGAMSGNLVAQWELFDLMEGTWPRLQKNLNQLKDGVCSFDWQVVPWAAKGEDPTPEAQKRAEFIEDLIWNMEPSPDVDENDFEGTLRDLMDAWGKGIVVLETDYVVRPLTTGSSQAVAPRATRWIHPRYYGYPITGVDALMLNTSEVLRTVTGPSAQQVSTLLKPTESSFAPFLLDKFVIGIAKQKSGHPTGSSLLRALGFWWAAMNFTLEWFLNFAQIFGMPIRWASYDPNLDKPTIEVIKEMLQNMGSAAWAAFPAGVTLELKEAAKAGSDNPQVALMAAADKVCDILVLRQTLTTDAADRGTQALGTVHQDVLSDVKQGAANWCARMLNRQLIRALCRLNYGDVRECPYLLPNDKQVKDAKSLAERDKILSDLGVEFPKEWFYERHDVPVPEEGDEVLEPLPRGHQEADAGGAAPLPERVQAKDATDKVVDHVLENLTGVEAKWLGVVKPIFARLVAAAQDGKVSDAQFVQVLEQAQQQMPELFRAMDHNALEDALYKSMSAAVVNGALKGSFRTGTASRRSFRTGTKGGGR